MSKKLIIVGTGLNKGSMTLAGIEAIKKADVILYDRLIDKNILTFAECLCIDVGKKPYDKHCVRQDDINTLIKQNLAKNQCVVRLKGGDSSIFARTSEEVSAAREVGADVEIIAGITSASALSARLKSALTDRRSASGVVFITGHTKEDDLEHAYNWKALAELGLGIVVYMGVRNMPLIASKLVGFGMNDGTPVLIGENILAENERIMFTTLKDVESFITQNNVKHPATIIIGEIVNNAEY